MLNQVTKTQLPPQIQQILPVLNRLNNQEKFLLINYLSQPTQPKSKSNRKLGTLADKASVSFADDWEMTDEELLGL